jgi:hypothetical protein
LGVIMCVIIVELIIIMIVNVLVVLLKYWSTKSLRSISCFIVFVWSWTILSTNVLRLASKISQIILLFMNYSSFASYKGSNIGTQTN